MSSTTTAPILPTTTILTATSHNLTFRLRSVKKATHGFSRPVFFPLTGAFSHLKTHFTAKTLLQYCLQSLYTLLAQAVCQQRSGYRGELKKGENCEKKARPLLSAPSASLSTTPM